MDILSDIKAPSFKVYAKSKNGLVYTIYSTCFHNAEWGDTLIKEGLGDEFVHVSYYQIYDENTCHNYKIVDEKMVECTNEEKEEELKQKQQNTNIKIDESAVKTAKLITDLMLGE